MSICTMRLETVKSTQNVDICMEIPIQHGVYIWAELIIPFQVISCRDICSVMQ